MRYAIWWFIAISAAIGGIVIAFTVPKDAEHQRIHWFVFITWTMLPPAWFLGDAAARIQPCGRGKLNDCEKFFYESAAKFWAAGLAVLTAIYTADKLLFSN